MGLFGKKKEKNEPCCCGESGACVDRKNPEAAKGGEASVEILGSGCAKCNQLEAATREALTRLGMDSSVKHVTDFAQIAAYGVMTTPALVVDGKVASCGRVLTVDEVAAILQRLRG